MLLIYVKKTKNKHFMIGRSKPVAFAVKTNVAFEGSLDDDSPVHGSAVSFAIGDYLHVMER